MNILVTGGCGFLGAYITAALQSAGHEVFVYDIALPRPELLDVAPILADRFIAGEISDDKSLFDVCRENKIQVIIHAAAQLGLEASLANPVGFYRTNVMGTVNVCETARKLEMRKLLLISSNAVYHQGMGDKLCETDPPFSIFRSNPAAHYGVSKMAAEAIGMTYAEFHGVDFMALRVTAVYGFGMSSPIHIKPMIENAVRGKPTRYATGGRMKRDYTHVLDASAAVALAVDVPQQCQGKQRILNVAAGEICTVAEIAATVRRVVPHADIEIGNDFTSLEEENVKMRAPLDIATAKRILKWSPRWSIERGIKQYADRYRSYVSQTR
jgi:nucleoside-diphosphate-sugar epimerase